MATVGSHQQAAFTAPVNGTSPIDADEVRLNDNGMRATYNAHDGDATIHIQSSTLALRPAAGTAGRIWVTTDAGNLRTWFDDGASWLEIGNDHINFRVRATEILAKGDVLKAAGWNPGASALDVAKVSSASDVAIGIAREALSIGGIGYAVNTGTVTGLNTSAFTEGQILYPNTSGGLTSTKPTSGSYQAIAFVVRSHPSQGILLAEASQPLFVESSTNVAGNLVRRDGSGNFAAGTITATFSGNLTGNVTGNVTGDVSGNAGTATKLSSARTFALTGDVTGSVSSDLTSGASIAATYAGTVPINKGGTNLTATPTNGQLLIGNGTGYSLATLTAGSNINITNGAGSITIEAVLGGGSVSGSGTVGFVPRWTGTTSVSDSTLRDDGSVAAAGTAVDASYAFSVGGSLKVTGTTTNIRAVNYVWPASQGASGTALVNDGSGNLSWQTALSAADTMYARATFR